MNGGQVVVEYNAVVLCVIVIYKGARDHASLCLSIN